MADHVERSLSPLAAVGLPSASRVRAAVRDAYVKAAKEAEPSDHPIPPVADVLDGDAGPVEREGAIGLGLSVGDDCLMVRVIDGDVEVWSPGRIQLKPGELTCDGGTATFGAGQRPPH